MKKSREGEKRIQAYGLIKKKKKNACKTTRNKQPLSFRLMKYLSSSKEDTAVGNELCKVITLILSKCIQRPQVNIIFDRREVNCKATLCF